MKRNSTLEKQTDLERLAEDAKALITATGHVADEKVAEARKRLEAALEKGRDTWEDIQARAHESIKTADASIRENPYPTIGIAFGVGALIGFLISRRN